MAKSMVLSLFAAFVGLIGFVFALVAICTNYWLTNDGGNYSGLWRVCREADGNCDNLIIGSSVKYANYEMVRGFGVLAVIMALLGTIVTVLDVAIRSKDIGASVMATLYLMAAFFGLTGVGLFTSLASGGSASWGYSFGLGWASFPLTLIAGGIMTYMELSSNK